MTSSYVNSNKRSTFDNKQKRKMHLSLKTACTVQKYGWLDVNGKTEAKRERVGGKMIPRAIPKEKTKFSRVRAFMGRTTIMSAVTSPSLSETNTELGKGSVLEIAENIHVVKCTCVERLKFEVEYGLKRGTSDNSYLIQGSTRDSTILIDIPVESFQTSFILSLQKFFPLKKIGKIILTHLDPKSVPVLKQLLHLMNRDGTTPVEIYATATALRLLEECLTVEEVQDDVLKKCVLKRAPINEELEFADDNLSLEFVRIATPRWPDMLAVYLPQRKILFSSKLFAAHVAPQLAETKVTPFDLSGWEMYGNDWKFYFDTMLATSSNQVSKALGDLMLIPTASSALLPSIQDFWSQFMNWFSQTTETAEKEKSISSRHVAGICPMHGPVITNSLNELVNCYSEWLDSLNTAVGNIAVYYASAYGNTAALAQAISHGISKANISVKTINLEIADPSEVQESINQADGFIIGSPTLGGHMPTQVQSALGTILRESKAKKLPCGVFGSFGWSGEAVDEMSQRLRDGGFTFSFDPIKVKFKPTAKDLQLCEESGTDLAQTVLKKMKKATKQSRGVVQARTASSAAQAIGRVVGTLCIISGKDGDAESGMLASWVSQASFNPPGLTVSVKRDRALENVLMEGNRFVINILPEGKERALVKHMSQPFEPGEDRFHGLATTNSSETDCVILDEAVSYVECTVKKKMEAGDHWIIYATVDGGAVLDTNNVSAVHHRTVGTSY